MKKLKIKKDGQFEGVHVIDKERLWIGRAVECDIRVDDPAVSTRHARIITILDNSFVEDMESTNGTSLNGEPVDKQELQNGDTITVGKLELLFLDDEQEDEDTPEPEEQADLEKTIVVSPDSPTFNEGSERQTKAIEEAEDEARQSVIDSGKNTKRCFVKVMTGPAAGKTLEMKKPLVTLGRPGLQVAVISKRPGGYYFTYVEGGDEEGKQPLINGDPSGSEARQLHNYDIIELAGNRIQVILSDDG